MNILNTPIGVHKKNSKGVNWDLTGDDLNILEWSRSYDTVWR